MFQGDYPKQGGDFWAEFYADVKTRDKKGFDRMVNRYPDIYEGTIDLALISGKGVTQRIKKIVGPTLYEKNIGHGTLRDVFGKSSGGYEMPDTIVHAPKPEEVAEQLNILGKYNLI